MCDNTDAPEGIMVSEISRRKTNIVSLHLYIESKKAKQMNKQNKADRFIKNLFTENKPIVA